MKSRLFPLAAALALLAALPVGAAEITVYKNPDCGCCTQWVEHMRQAGFTVLTRDVEDVDAVKLRLGVPGELASCHTALVNGYVVEGHVPAADVKRLLEEAPAVKGIAVPGMPLGSPGMEGPYKAPYDVVTFQSDGATAIFSHH